MLASQRLCFAVVCLAIAVPMLRSQTDEKQQTARDDAILKAHKLKAEQTILAEFLRRSVASPDDQKKISALVERLGHRIFRIREKAAHELEQIGPAALPQLRLATKAGDLEARLRAEKCITQIEKQIKPEVHVAALRVLAGKHPDAACQAVFDYLPFAVNEAVSETAKALLEKCGVRNDKIAGILINGLNDKNTARRATSAFIVGRRGSADQQKQVQKLLNDPQAVVRFHAAQGLLIARNKAGVPALLALLKSGPVDLAEQVEEMFQILAEEKGPKRMMTAEMQDRAKSHDEWKQWWQAPPQKLAWADLNALLPGGFRDSHAGRLAKRFLTALTDGDLKTLAKITDVPFHLGPEFNIKGTKELETIFRQATTEQKKANIKIRIVSVLPAQIYLNKEKNSKNRALINSLAGTESIFIVTLEATDPGRGKQEGGAMMVRRRGGQAHVIGIMPHP